MLTMPKPYCLNMVNWTCIEDYQKAVGKRDRKLLRLVTLAYDNMHIYMGYDGNRNKDLSDSCFRMANDIIDRCETMLSNANA